MIRIRVRAGLRDNGRIQFTARDKRMKVSEFARLHYVASFAGPPSCRRLIANSIKPRSVRGSSLWFPANAPYKQETGHADRGIDPECLCGTKRVIKEWKGIGKDKTRHPQCCNGDRHCSPRMLRETVELILKGKGIWEEMINKARA